MATVSRDLVSARKLSNSPQPASGLTQIVRSIFSLTSGRFGGSCPSYEPVLGGPKGNVSSPPSIFSKADTVDPSGEAQENGRACAAAICSSTAASVTLDVTPILSATS